MFTPLDAELTFPSISDGNVPRYLELRNSNLPSRVLAHSETRSLQAEATPRYHPRQPKNMVQQQLLLSHYFQ